MCAPSPPPSPDFVGAANAQGAANKEAAIASSRLNNPNVVSPFGTQTFTEGAQPDSRPTVTQTLNPEQQALLAQRTGVQTQLGSIAGQGAQSLSGVVGKPVDYSGAPDPAQGSEATRTKVINALMGRVDEDYGRQRDQANSDLIAAGLRPGTKAYQDRMFSIDRARTDARNQAEATAGGEVSRNFGIDTQARKDAIAEILSKRQTPLNEITALMSGSQVSNPFAVPGVNQGANIAPAPIFPATVQQGNYTTDLYNVGAAGAGNKLSGLFGLGAGALAGGYV